jgi:hypothetical protein
MMRRRLVMSLRAEQEQILSNISQKKKLDSSWDVYRNMYYLRLRGSLYDDFSDTEKLDQNSFSDWVDDFVYTVKSESADLAELSSKFPNYLHEKLSLEKKWIAEFAKRELLQLQSWSMWQSDPQPESIEDLSLKLRLSEHVILFQSLHLLDEGRWFLIYSSENNMLWEKISQEEFVFLEALNQWTQLIDIEKRVTSEVLLAKFSSWISKSLFRWRK